MRDIQIINLLLTGATNKEIAAELDLSVDTVKKLFSRIFMRYNIQGRNKRVKLAMIMGRRPAA
jgi:DNA-binding NarL/FixJ family response regulator